MLGHSEAITFYVPPDFGYAAVGQAFLSQLLGHAERARNPKDPLAKSRATVLVLRAEGSDPTGRYHHEGRLNGALHYEVRDGLFRFRQLLEKIRQSQHPWFFVGAGDCFGASWELAMACFSVLWCGEDARVGIPELKANFYPPGFFLERWAELGGKLKEHWREEAIVPVKDAESAGWVSAVVDAEISESVVGTWIERITTRTTYRAQPFAEPAQGANGLSTDDAMVVRRMWDFPKFKKRIPLESTRHALVCSQGARVLLSKNVPGLPVTPSAFAHECFTVEIRCDRMAPPAAVLSSLLKAGWVVGLVAADAGALVQRLQMVYESLASVLSKDAMPSIWSEQVYWYTAPLSLQAGVPALTFCEDHSVAIGAQAAVLRLGGNSIRAALGTCEALGQAASGHFDLFGSLADEIVVNHRFEEFKLPITVLFRFLFLKELQYLAFEGGVKPAVLMDQLADRGWVDVGSRSWWRDFIQLKERYYEGYPAGFADVLGISLPSWDSKRWEEAVLRSSRPQFKRSPKPLELHFAAFIQLVGRKLVQNGFFLDENATLRFLANCVGFPLSKGSPTARLQEYGERRLGFYIRETFPQFN